VKRLAEKLTRPIPVLPPSRPQRIYIVPTRAGLAFGGAVIALFAAALNHGNNLALLFACLLAGVGIAALVHTHLCLAATTLQAVEIPSVHCGHHAPCQVHLIRPGKTPWSFAVRAGAGPWTHHNAPPGKIQATAPLPTLKRGPLLQVEIGLATTYPLGLARAWTRMLVPVDAVIYPKPWPEYTFAHGRDQGAEAGVFRGEDPEDLRPFRSGDSVHRIAWKTSARNLARGGPLVVMERETGSRPWMFVWDTTPGEVEERVSRLTACVLDAHARGYPYGLVLPTTTIPPGNGETHLHRCLRTLALVPPA